MREKTAALRSALDDTEARLDAGPACTPTAPSS